MFSDARLAVLLNEWLRRYTESPKAFAKEFPRDGESYGAESVAYLRKLDAELPR